MSEPVWADLGAAKALANPLRQRILRELELLGEATSTVLADRLGVTTGGTSYNLRVLAKHGLVEEAPERARGRERWWRHVRRDVRFARRGEQDPRMRSATDELNRLWLAEDLEMFARFESARAELGEWSDAVPYSRGSIRVSLDELAAFFEDYLALLKKYQRPADRTPAGTRTVQTRFVAFPDPDTDPDPDADPDPGPDAVTEEGDDTTPTA
ncbi:helix-turn-helix domain-containing protein [Saccharothrix hoggarensis]|uniref:Helix-turn-helix domain-containing protein n=1 Tax=Saccharothrix hoggarensis TaxID=913853 RepID=A0ABW3R365_9PSEU